DWRIHADSRRTHQGDSCIAPNSDTCAAGSNSRAGLRNNVNAGAVEPATDHVNIRPGHNDVRCRLSHRSTALRGRHRLLRTQTYGKDESRQQKKLRGHSCLLTRHLLLGLAKSKYGMPAVTKKRKYRYKDKRMLRDGAG